VLYNNLGMIVVTVVIVTSLLFHDHHVARSLYPMTVFDEFTF